MYLMLNDDVSSLIVLGGAFVALWVVERMMLARRRWWQLACVVVAILTECAKPYGEAALARYRAPTVAAAAIEAEAMRASPVLVPILKQGDPEAWQSLIDRLAQQAASSVSGPVLNRWEVQAGIAPMVQKALLTIAHADDDAILALGRQEIALNEALQHESTVTCATRGARPWYPDALSPADAKVFQDYANLVAVAYQQGKGRDTALPGEREGRALAAQAAGWHEAPLTPEDVQLIEAGGQQDPTRACDIRVRLSRNVMKIPERVQLLRWMYARSAL